MTEDEFESDENQMNGASALFYALLVGIASWCLIFLSVYMLWLWVY